MHITAGFSFLAGIITHLAIRPFEIDTKPWKVLFLYLAVLALLPFYYAQAYDISIPKALLRTILVSGAFNAGLAGSILIYRAFFHRLHHFPGPFLAKLSRFYALITAAKTLKANEETQRLHSEYGDFVRVGPREISINRASAIRILYESPTQCPRSVWYNQVSDDVRKVSVTSTRDLAVHKHRKKAWMRGLGFRALTTYEERVASKVDLLITRLAERQGTPTNMSEYAMFFGFDVMGEVGFSKAFNMLSSTDKHPAIKGLHESMAAIGVLGTVPWLLMMLSKVPGSTGGYKRFIEWCGQELRARRIIFNSEKSVDKSHEPRDIMSWLLQAENEHDRSAPPGEQAIQEDARLMIIAGSDTTSVTLANALYFFTKHPSCYHKLQQLLRTQFPGGERDWTYEKAKTISYLDYIIYETLRLKPSVPGGLSRLTPPGGVQVDEVFIPGDTMVSVPTYTIQRDPRYWQDALEFRPERWESLNPEHVPWIPFTRGQLSCPGRNLAFMELRMALSRIALRFNIALAPGEDGMNFYNGAKDMFTLSVPELPLVFTSAT